MYGAGVLRVRETLRAHWPLMLAGFLYLYVFPYLPELRSPNELCRLYQTRALADFGTIEINSVIMRWGYVGDLSRMGTHLFPSKAPLLSYMAVPVYAVLKLLRGGSDRVPELALVYFARLFCTVLPAIFVLVPLRRFLRAYLEPRIADGALLTYAIGTLAYSYAELFMSHTTCAVLAFLSFFVLWRLQRGEWGQDGDGRWLRGREPWYALAGALAGLAIASEYTVALSIVPLAIYGFVTAKRRLRALVWAVAGILPPGAFLAWYHWRAFGSPFETGYKHLNDPGYQGWHTPGFLGITVPDLQSLGLSFFSPLRGLFMLSPVLLLAIPGIVLAWRKRIARAEMVLAAASLVLYTYFTSSFSYASWGWTTGPRHMTSLVPFLMLPVGVCIASLAKQSMLRGAATSLAALSIVNTGLATNLNYIPDSVSNAVHHLVLPLVERGDLANNLLAFVGVPAPASGVVALVALTGAAVGTIWLWRPEARSLAAMGLSAALAGLLFFAQGLLPSYRSTPADEDAVRFLSARATPQPGHASPPLFGP
jgi:hypothetical protein